MARSCPTARFGEAAPCHGGVCLVPRVWWDVGEMTGSSASLEGLSRLIPLNALGPPGLSILHAQIKPNQQGPPHTGARLPGALLPSALCLVFTESLTPSFVFLLSPSSHPAQLFFPNAWVQTPHSPSPRCCPGLCPLVLSRLCSGCGEERKTRAGASPASALQSLSCRYK